MSVNSIAGTTSDVAIQKKQNNTSSNQNFAQNSIMSSTKAEAEDKMNARLEERTNEIADLISKKGEKTTKNSSIAAGVGDVALLAGAACCILGGGPVVIGGAIAAALGAVTTIFSHVGVNNGQVTQNEANNYSGDEEEKNDTIPKKIADMFLGNSTDNLPSQEKLADAASKLKDTSGGKYTDIYIYKDDDIISDGQNINQNAVLGHLDIIETDLSVYDTKTVKDDNLVGYSKDSYTFAKEYTQVFNEFNNVSASGGKLNDKQTQKIAEIACAVQSAGFEEEKKIFDINNDGYLNVADLTVLDYVLNRKSDELNTIVQKWDENNGNLDQAIIDIYDIDQTQPYSKVLESINSKINSNDFDINKDGYVDETDLQYFKNTNINSLICDINADDKVDDADKEILKSYLKANMDRLDTIRKEASEIEGVTFIDGQISDEYIEQVMGLN